MAPIGMDARFLTRRGRARARGRLRSTRTLLLLLALAPELAARQPAEPAPPAVTAPSAVLSAAAPVDPPSAEAAPSTAAQEAPAVDAPAEELPAPLDGPGMLDEPGAEDEVVITVARTRRAPGAVHVVGAETLERYKYDDPHAALQLVPGVYVRQEDGFGLRPNIGIRGAISDRSQKVALHEDGVLFGPAPYSAPAAYYFPVMARMRQLQVIKGPAAVKYGPQTVGGAIDLRTRAIPAAPSAMFDVAVGEYLYGKLHGAAGFSNGRSGALLEGIHLRSDGFKELPSGDETGFWRNEWMLKGNHAFDLATSHRIGIKLTYSDEQSDETYLGLTDADFRRNPWRRYGPSERDRMQLHRTSLVVTHEIEPLEGMRLTTSAYRHDLERNWYKVNHFGGASLFAVLTGPEAGDNRAFYDVLSGAADSASAAQQLYVGPNQRSYVSQGVQSQLTLPMHTGPVAHRLEAGLRLHYDRVERRHSEDAFDVVAGQLRATNTPTVLTTLNQAETYALAAYVSDEARWGALSLSPGVRLEVIRSRFEDDLAGAAAAERSLWVPLPGIGLHYAFTDEFGVLMGVHRGMSPPPPGSAADIEPEISINYEAGARYQARNRRAELIGYYNDYQNLTDVCTLSSGCDGANLDRQFAAGRARIYGFEALAEDVVELSGWRFPVSLSYTLTLTEFLETFESQDPIFGEVEAGDEFPYVPRHQGRGSLGVETGRTGGYVALNFVDRMRERSGSGPIELTLATDRQITLDVGAHYQLLDELRLYLQVRNLLDDAFIASRRPYGARPNAPRWIQLGATVELE